MSLPFPALTRAVVLFALLLATALYFAPSQDASARRTVAVIPNGTYGATAPGGYYVYFTVRNRKVRNLAFQFQITCQASDEPTSEQRFFSSTEAPDGRTIPNNGKLFMRWMERSEGRYGQVSAELKFGVRDVANFSAIIPEDRFAAGPDDTFESCDGVGSLRFHRGSELVPPPVVP